MTKETKRNLNKITRYNPHTSRAVDNISPLNTYNKEFSALNSSAVLDIDIKEMPVPCTISPPLTDSWCTTTWRGDWVGGGQTHDTCFAEGCCGGVLVNWHMEPDSLKGSTEYVADVRYTYITVPVDDSNDYWDNNLIQAERDLQTVQASMDLRLNIIYPIQFQALIDIYEHWEPTGGIEGFLDSFKYPVYSDYSEDLSYWYLKKYDYFLNHSEATWWHFWNFVWQTGYPCDQLARYLPTYTEVLEDNTHLGSWYRGDLIWTEEIYNKGWYPFYEHVAQTTPYISGNVNGIPNNIQQIYYEQYEWSIYEFDYSWFEQQVAEAQAVKEENPPAPTDPPTQYSYTLSQSGIILPEDGCYLITYKGQGWGVSYFDDAIQEAYILLNGRVVASGKNESTGFIWTLGPIIPYWPPITNLVAYVEARKGDVISCLANASGFHKCYGWVAGSFLKGDYAPYPSTLTVELVASAEGVRPRPQIELVAPEPNPEPIVTPGGGGSTPPPQPPDDGVVINPPEFIGEPTGESLQALIDVTPTDGVADITGLIYTGSIIINKPMTLKGGVILVPTSTTNGVAITYPGVTLDGVTISGYANINTSSTGIYAYRADGLIIKNCNIEDFRYAGILIHETTSGEVYNNNIKRIGMNLTGATSAYGIIVSNSGGIQSSNINTHHNDIDYVPNGCGLYSGGNISCKFNDNNISNCNRAIYITKDTYDRYSSNIEASRNTCDTPTPRMDMLYTYPYNEVGITVVTGCTGVYGDGNMLDGWPTGYAIDTQNSGAIFVNTVITNSVSPPAPSVNYYISPNGSDTFGDGSINNPWASMSKFIAKPPAPDDVLYCRGGTFSGAGNRMNYMTPSMSGTSGHPVTVKNYPGEVAIFDGQSAGGWLIGSRSDTKQGASWWVIEGLHFKNYGVYASLISVGNWSDNDTAEVGNWVIRNNRVLNWAATTENPGDHCIYISVNAKNVTIEDNYFKGPYPIAGVGEVTGACLHYYHWPYNTGHIVRRNIIESWQEGIQIWDQQTPRALEVTITHNTFLDCGINIDARYHSTLIVRDNAGTNGRSYNLYDPYDYASTTADYNFWGQTFNSSYYLLPGNTGIKAASDGTDAGALNSSVVETSTSYYISPTGSDTTGNGTFASPWKTIQKWFNSAPSAGETLYVRGGTYSNQPSSVCGNGTPGLLGTANAPITIRNYPGEVPIFSGGSGPLIGIAGKTSPTAYVVIDGIQCTGRMIGDSGGIYVGAWASSGYNVSYVTIRNYKFTMAYGDVINRSHGAYISEYAEYTTIEDSVFIGAGAGGGGGDGITCGGAWQRGNVIQRCIFKNFSASGMSIFGGPGETSFDTLVSHCSFINNTPGAIRIEHHGPTTIINCASTSVYTAPTPWTAQTAPAGAPWIYHYYASITDVTQTSNFFSQTFDANHYLLAGNSGIKAATDGKDAGALNSTLYPPSSSSITVNSIPALLSNLANNSLDEIVVANGTYLVSTAGSRASNSLWIGSAFASRTRAIIVRAQTVGGVTFSGGGTTYFGGLTFIDGAHHQTWDGFKFANGEATNTGVIVFGAYTQPRPAPHHITLKNITMTDTCTSHTPAGSYHDHAIYFSEATGGPNNIVIDNLQVFGDGTVSQLDSAIHFYHSEYTANANNVLIKNMKVTKTDQAVIMWDKTLYNIVIEDSIITGARIGIRYEDAGSGIVLRRVSTVNSTQAGFYSSLGSNPPGISFENCSFG